MNDFIEETRGKVAGAKSKQAGDTIKLVLELNRETGALKSAAGVVKDRPLPVVNFDGEPVTFEWWHHQDILISNKARDPDSGHLGREDGCPTGYTHKVICGVNCCVPI